jgi:hypothetical protein
MSTQIGQKQAVIDAVASVLGSNFTSGLTVVRDTITSDQLDEVREIVLNGIAHGTVTYGKDSTDEKAVRRYVNGMIDNHFRKATELNGGNKYTAPASSARGARDAQLSTLKKLLKTFEEGSEQYNQVAEAIETRTSFLATERATAKASRARASKASEIDMSVLPLELQELINSSISA